MCNITISHLINCRLLICFIEQLILYIQIDARPICCQKDSYQTLVFCHAENLVNISMFSFGKNLSTFDYNCRQTLSMSTWARIVKFSKIQNKQTFCKQIWGFQPTIPESPHFWLKQRYTNWANISFALDEVPSVYDPQWCLKCFPCA